MGPDTSHFRPASSVAWPAHTLGIDLASQPENTAVCRLAWHADHVEVAYLERGRDAQGPLDDDRLLKLMLDPGSAPLKIGFDAPLGWPVAFVRAVADLDAWPLADEADTKDLTHRATDRWVHLTAQKLPLSVSSDRLAYPAMRAARLVRRFQAVTGELIDRTGVTGAVCEVYPDTAVTRFGLRPEGSRRLSYKGAAGAPVRDGMLDRLVKLAPWLQLSDLQRSACIDSDDHFDALIAALVTRSVSLGLTYPPPAEMARDAATEGWIHLPRVGGLAELAPAAYGPLGSSTGAA